MPVLWKNWALAERICNGCGSVYRVTATRLPHTERGAFRCIVCDRRLGAWAGREVRAFDLLRAGHLRSRA